MEKVQKSDAQKQKEAEAKKQQMEQYKQWLKEKRDKEEQKKEYVETKFGQNDDYQSIAISELQPQDLVYNNDAEKNDESHPNLFEESVIKFKNLIKK